MKIVLDTPDDQFSFVKAALLTAGASNEKALFLAEFGEAIDELNNVLAGKAQDADAYPLLDEL